MNKYQITAKTYLAGESNSKVQEIAAKHGIVLPSEDLGIFLSVYSPIEDANLNKVRLASDAVTKALSTLNGKLADINHVRPYVIGSILEGFINDNNEIVIAFTFYKSVFQDEYQRAIELMADNKLTVSFELTTNPDTIEYMADKTVRLHDINFSGVGVLLDQNPAYPKAVVYEQANNLLKKVRGKDLVFASAIEEILKNNEKGGHTDMNDEQKKKVADLKAELGETAKDWNDEDFLNDAKVEEARATLKAAITITTKENCTTVESVDDAGTHKVQKTDEVNQEMVDGEGNKQTYQNKTDTTTVMTYSQAQVDEIKAEAEKSVNELKAENESLKAKVADFEAKEAAKKEAEKAEKLAAIKAELKDNTHTKDFKDEDYFDENKVKQAKILKENDDLKAENASLKQATPAKQEVVASKEELVTGHGEKSKEVSPRSLIRKIGK